MKKQIIGILIGLFLFNGLAWSWSEKTHVILTYQAIIKAILIKYPDLMHTLGMAKNDGQPLKYNDKTLYFDGWMRYGAEREDASTLTRSNNHFHNPLNSFMNAGLSDISCGLSSIIWAQSPNNQISVKDGDNSWQKTRETFFDGLIEKAPDKRKEYFAQMFKALGHQCHLIQDMAVPDHVRNDAHVLNSILGGAFTFKLGHYRCIEGWAVHNSANIVSFTEYPCLPEIDLKLPSVEEDTNLPAPISRVTDINVYNGSNPSSSVSQGLSEYTNANFFSEDTISSINNTFPQPIINGTDTELYAAGLDDAAFPGIKKWYYKKKNGQTLNHLACKGYFQHHIQSQGHDISWLEYFLDNKCHEEYCSLLVPRAVGSSMALIDYYFRGKIEIALPDDGIYAFCDQNEPYFKQIKLRGKNITPDEEMYEGSLKLVIRYREGIGGPLDNDDANPVDIKTDEKYIVLDTSETMLSRSVYTTLTFDLPVEKQLPINAIDVSFSLVFKGKLGQEQDAVAFGYKDVSEPTPIMPFNNTDYVCVSQDGTNNWYQNGDPVLNAIQDEKHCVFHPFVFNVKAVAFNGQLASSTNFFKKYDEAPRIEANQYFVFYVLGDADKRIDCSVWVDGEREPGNSYCDQSYAIPTSVYDVLPYQNTVHSHLEMVNGTWETISDYKFYRLWKFRSHRYWGLSYYCIDYPPMVTSSCDAEFFKTPPSAAAFMMNETTKDNGCDICPDDPIKISLHQQVD